MTRTAQAGVALVAILASLLAQPSSPAAAQRPTPTPGSGASVEQLKRYGTRLALPVPRAIGGALFTLRLTNAGWRPTRWLVVEAGAPPAATCPTRDTALILRSHCGGTALGPLALAEQTLYDADVAAAVARSVLVYSLAADGADTACAQFAEVQAGRMSLADWERTAWLPGEPLAALAHGVAGGGETGLAGEVSLGVAGITGGRPNRPGAGGLRQYLPAAWPTGQYGGAVALNMATDCATMDLRLGTGDTSPCDTPQPLQVKVPPLSVQALAVPGANGPRALSGQVQGEALLAAEGRDGAGWWSYAGAGASNESGGVSFPLAVGPLPDNQADLYVTNVNMTATAKVELVMFDGNQGLHKLYTDPVLLCAGGTRRYDITKLAGTIPPTTGGRPGAAGPPLLALRVQGTSAETQQAPMLSGVMVLRNGQGVTAYGGQATSVGTQVFQTIRRLQPGLSVWTVVPGVKKNAGPDRRTTLLAIQTLGNPQAENGAYVDLYDAAGQIVASEVQVRLGDGPAGFLDLSSARARLPDGFVGTAVVRGVQNRGTLAVVAVDHAAAPTAGDTQVSWPGVILPRWPNPYAATPTAVPTRDPGLPTATPRPTREPRTPRPTLTGTATLPAGSATASATAGPSGPPLYLPFAARFRYGDMAAARVGRAPRH